MVAQVTRPSHNGHKTTAVVIHNDAYSLDQRLSVSGNRSLYLGQQRGVDRPILVERVDHLSPATITSALDRKALAENCCHSNVAQLVDAFAEERALYTIIAAGASGHLLSDHVNLSPAQVVVYGIHLCNALGYLEHHHLPLVAADIVPGNVYITSAGRARFIALAALLGVHADGRHSHFLAPHCEEPAASVFSLGATLHHSLSWWSGDYRAGAPALASTRADISPELDTVISQALNPDPAQRYATIADLRLALLRLQ